MKMFYVHLIYSKESFPKPWNISSRTPCIGSRSDFFYSRVSMECGAEVRSQILDPSGERNVCYLRWESN
jgi:hypothetical protein